MFDTDKTTRRHSRFFWIFPALAAAAFGLIWICASNVGSGPRSETAATVRVRTIDYVSHDGVTRRATVILPGSLGNAKNSPIPLVISPHGRNGTGSANATYWGNLPGVGGFAVVNPDGMGRRLGANSFGYRGQIDDLARMPQIVEAALPWVRIDRHRVYVLGSSMGGQETLLLVARHPHLLAGAVALDSVTNLSRRYRQMPKLECDAACLRRYGKPYGRLLQKSLATEVGGTPAMNPRLYEARSPLDLAKRIAASGVHLQIWWSRKDKIVVDQAHQSGALYKALRQLDRCAPVSEYVGKWAHSHEMRSTQLLPIALVHLGLLDATSRELPDSVQVSGEPACANV